MASTRKATSRARIPEHAIGCSFPLWFSGALRRVQRLRHAANVNVIVAAVFVSVVDEAVRFRNAHQVAYLGLVPAEKSSGDRRRLGAITKQGNSYARAMLMQASWGLTRSARQEDPLQQWARAVASRRGKFIAAVALARRLAGIMWAMWRDDRTYRADHIGSRSAAGLAQQADDISSRALAMKAAARKAQQRARPHERKLELQKRTLTTEPQSTPSADNQKRLVWSPG